MKNFRLRLQKKDSTKKRIKKIFGFDDDHLVQELEEAGKKTDELKDVPSPEGEFQKILKEMENRGIALPVELEDKMTWQKRCRQYCREYGRPALVSIVVVAVIGVTGIGVWASRAYDFRMRNREKGKVDIVWNNDPDVLITDEENMDKVYEAIGEKLDIPVIIMEYIPFDMKFEKLKVTDEYANIEFKEGDQFFYVFQSKRPVRASHNYVSDRETYKSIYNKMLQQQISISKNKVNGKDMEYSAEFTYKGSYYFFTGVTNEDEFTKIIENLYYKGD